VSKSTKSFINLTAHAFKLLSLKQRLAAFKNILYSTAQALLEVLSITAIAPLLLQFDNKTTSIISKHIVVPTSLSWQTILLIIVVIFIVKNFMGFWLAHHQAMFIHSVSLEFSEKLYHRFYNQSWVNYIKDNSAEAVRKIKATPFNFSNYVLFSYLALITDISICLFMTAALIWFDYNIILVTIALCFPIGLFYYFFQKKILSKINDSFQTLSPKASVVLTQGIDSFAEARIYQKENFFIERFIKIRQLTSKNLATLKTVLNLPNRFFETISILCLATVIIYSRFNPNDREQVILFLGLFSIAMYKVVPSLNRILVSLSQIQAHSYTIEELNESFNSAQTITKNENSKLIFSDAITLKNLSFTYEGSNNFLLKNINFTINKGDFILIEGTSGAGKTTLIHLLAGLIDNYEGQLLVDKTTLTPSLLKSWQNKIGFVSQAPIVLQDTVLRNVTFGEEEREINMSNVEMAIELAGLRDFINSLPQRLNTSTGENGLMLSGGQRQRLILARTLYRNPEILLLDEVTNQLDEDNKQKILEILLELSKKGKTVILVSHDHVVRNFATRIVSLKEGEIVGVK
jgi:ATP-binding cassette, subfamily B, bacterial PglK